MGNRGLVVRAGDTVRRPAGPQSAATARLLEHLAQRGFEAPRPLGTDETGRDVFSWVEGKVPVPPFPPWSQTDDALASVGALVRRLHDAVHDFRSLDDDDWNRELADPAGGPIVCHNDVCPENVVFRGGRAAALLDFDFAAPGPAVWDLAATARMWIPLRPERSAEPPRRLAVLAHAYGLAPDARPALVEAIVTGKRVGGAFVRRRAAAGEAAFAAAWLARGGDKGDAAIVAWLESSRGAFLEALQR
jgi:aminoglycoside phosphotransferase (APT) family kinase protein